jgi:magnesium transporter
MLTFHDIAKQTSAPWAGQSSLPDGVNWIDALSPTLEESAFLRDTLKFEPPSLERMSEIESSSRLYRSRDALVVTLPLPSHGGALGNTPLALAVTPLALVTTRFEPLKVCEPQQVAAGGVDRALPGPYGALLAIVESIIDHLADQLEAVTAALVGFSHTVFDAKPKPGRQSLQTGLLKRTIQEIGRKRELTSQIEETLLALDRMIGFVEQEAASQLSPEARARLDRAARDVASLSSHENRLGDKIQFLLDASLGLIGVEQNDIFKVLTLVSVIGIPPTLIASMYGMNFKNIPEYDWPWGYQYGLTLIAVSILLPLLWFKWRKWW